MPWQEMESLLSHRDHMHCPVELAVAAPIEAHPLDLSRAGQNRRHSSQGREGVGSPEAAHVAGLGNEPGRATVIGPAPGSASSG